MKLNYFQKLHSLCDFLTLVHELYRPKKQSLSNVPILFVVGLMAQMIFSPWCGGQASAHPAGMTTAPTFPCVAGLDVTKTKHVNKKIAKI